MKPQFLKPLVALLLFYTTACAQSSNSIEPGNKTLNPIILNKGEFEWGWFQETRGNLGNELGTESVKVYAHAQHIYFIKQRLSKKLDVNETDSLVLNAKTLAPIYHSFKNDEFSYYIQYTDQLKGVRTIFETKKKENLTVEFDGKYFDKQSLPLLISMLPLKKGFTADIPIIDFNSEFKPTFYKYKITDTEDIETVANRSGKHAVWKVIVTEKKRGHQYDIYIDKDTRRILRIDFMIPATLLTYSFFDKELDVSPIKSIFNIDETIAMLTKGSSSIKGQAYTVGYGKKMGGLRDKKKQYAEKGSIVLLIPNTPYFKEWVEYNLRLSKLTGPVYTVDFGGMFGDNNDNKKTVIGNYFPLPEEVSKCILLTKVSDNKGGFSFQHLKPGEYLVFVSFMADEYSHTTRDLVGQQLTITGDGYINSYPIWDVQDWTQSKTMRIHKFISIKKEGEIVEVPFNH